MTENEQTFKSFNQPPEPAQLPPPLAELLDGRLLLERLSSEDLREMSKFGEIPNVEGLAAHPVLHPFRKEQPPKSENEIPEAIIRALRQELIHQPSILVRGALAGASGRPFVVQVIVPQMGAHLALALQKMLWPAEDTAVPAAYTLFIWTGPLKNKRGRTLADNRMYAGADQGYGISIGHDDLFAERAMLLDAARAYWGAAGAGQGSRMVDCGLRSRRPTGPSPLDCGIIIADEEVPGPREDCLVEDEQWVTPVWVYPMLPAAALAVSEAWRRAALGIGAVLLGVTSDDASRFPLLHGSPGKPEAQSKEMIEKQNRGGWVVVPRGGFPEPFMREARRWSLGDAAKNKEPNR